MRSQSLESEWHKNVEVPAVTGFVMGGGLQCVELLDSKVVWKAGDCNRIRLMTGEKRARGKARGSEVCSEKSRHVMGLQIHVPMLCVEVKGEVPSG